jgi:uncharacterized protein (DUF2249 family)
MSSSFATTIDVREITPRDGQPMTFITFDALAPGQSLQLVNDHGPRALHYQFDDRCPGAFGWAYLVGAAPAAWNSCCSGWAGCS